MGTAQRQQDLGSVDRLSPVRTVNNCHRASLKSMLYLAKGDTVTLLQRVMALAKELKQQVTWRFGKVGQVPRKRQATSRRLQASGLTIDDYRIIKDDNERIKYAKRKKRCLR